MKVLLLAVFVLFPSCKCRKERGPSRSLFPVIASVTFAENDVKRRIHRQIDWNKVMEDTELFQKDTVMTLAESRAVVTFRDESNIKVGENSLVVIERPKKIERRIDTKLYLKEGTLNRTFKSSEDQPFISEIKTDRLITYISSRNGKVGLKYRKNRKLKIAVYSGQTKINTVVNKKEVEKEESKEDLLEVAVYKGGEARLQMDVVKDKTGSVDSTVIELKDKDLIQVTHKNLPKTPMPVKNRKEIDILKEDFLVVQKKPEPTASTGEDKTPVFRRSDVVITLNWKEIQGAGTYFLDISKTRSFRDVFETKVVNDNLARFPIQRFRKGTYYWQVAPVVGGHIKEYGRIKSFIVSGD